MTPVEIDGFNVIAHEPAGWDPMSDGECGALKIKVSKSLDGNISTCESAWLPSPEELAMLAGGGHVVLRVFGMQVPVMLEAAPGQGSHPVVLPDSTVRDALSLCADQFDFYACEHEAAGKTEKAATNARFAQIARTALSGTAAGRDARQTRAGQWVRDAFGIEHSASLDVRAMRVLEEAAELAQALGLTIVEALHVVKYVFGRPPGSVPQEIGGLGLGLIALCAAIGISADAEEERELQRVLSMPLEHFRLRQTEKAAAGLGSTATAGGYDV